MKAVALWIVKDSAANLGRGEGLERKFTSHKGIL